MYLCLKMNSELDTHVQKSTNCRNLGNLQRNFKFSRNGHITKNCQSTRFTKLFKSICGYQRWECIYWFPYTSNIGPIKSGRFFNEKSKISKDYAIVLTKMLVYLSECFSHMIVQILKFFLNVFFAVLFVFLCQPGSFFTMSDCVVLEETRSSIIIAKRETPFKPRVSPAPKPAVVSRLSQYKGPQVTHRNGANEITHSLRWWRDPTGGGSSSSPKH